MIISTYKTMLEKKTLKNILVAENTFEYIGNNDFTNPMYIVDFMNTLFKMNERAEEYTYILAFNTKMKMLGVFEVSHGTCNGTILSPREIYIRALLCGATYIILIHNHPSQIAKPSKEDIEVTKRIKDAGDIINVVLLDHIIIGENFISLKEQNYM